MESHSLDTDALAKNFLKKAKSLPKIEVAVVYPCSEDSLKGAIEAAEIGLIKPILVGPEKKIRELAKKEKIDLKSCEIINADDEEESVLKGIALIREGKAEAIMKGSLHTDALMRQIVKKENGLRTARRITHAFIMAIENYHKPFIITDAAINITPDLMTKRDIIQNSIDLIRAFDKNIKPKVAILSAVETVNPDIPSTIDAACLCKMADRHQINNGIVDGPFAYDNVLSIHAAKVKNIESPVVGDADIFVVPNLEAGNMLAKQLVLIADAIAAGIIIGARVPIILTSRADGVRSRISSCAIAVMMADATRKHMLEEEI